MNGQIRRIDLTPSFPLIAMMLPYCVSDILLWSVFFFVWVFVLGMPVGPVEPTYNTAG